MFDRFTTTPPSGNRAVQPLDGPAEQEQADVVVGAFLDVERTVHDAKQPEQRDEEERDERQDDHGLVRRLDLHERQHDDDDHHDRLDQEVGGGEEARER